MSKKKKNALTLLVLGVLLVAGLALYFMLPQVKEDGGEAKDNVQSQEAIIVDTIDTENISLIAVQKKGEVVLNLVKPGDTWLFEKDKKIPVNQEAVTALFSALAPVEATREMALEGVDVGDYGLRDGEMIIDIGMKDGTNYRYELGATVPVEGGNYGLTAAGDKIYCFSDALYSAFDIDEISLIQMDELPDMDTEKMKYIFVDNAKGEDFEAKVVKEGEQISKYSSWNITKPFAKPLGTSSTNWETTLSQFASLSFEEMVEYDAKNLEKYGLSKPSSTITVDYLEEKAKKRMVLYVGDKNGESYYVAMKGSKNVYTMSADSVESMTMMDAFDSMDHCVYATLITDIEGYDVSYGDVTMKITRTLSDEKKEKNKDEYKNIWKVDGKVIAEDDEERFLTPYSTAYLLTFTSVAKDSVKPKSNKPVLTLVYHEGNRDVTVKYMPYDGTNFYRVNKDGMDYFLVDKMSVDAVMEEFEKLREIL